MRGSLGSRLSPVSISYCREPRDDICLCSGQVGSLDEEERPTACVGICYYNKLMALEAKEDLANHNMVYKNEVKELRKFTRLGFSNCHF